MRYQSFTLNFFAAFALLCGLCVMHLFLGFLRVLRGSILYLMEKQTMIRKLLASVLALSMSYFGMAQAAPTLVTTGQVAAAQDAAYIERDRALVLDTLQRADVQAKMQELGVDPAAAQQRVAALSDAEIARLARSIETDPAGGTSVLGFLLTIFIVLLVTDILGFTQVFPFVKHGSARAQ
jgi:hypothetical protein